MEKSVTIILSENLQMAEEFLKEIKADRYYYRIIINEHTLHRARGVRIRDVLKMGYVSGELENLFYSTFKWSIIK